ncbi:MAG: ABC transporter permease [Actinobacteria bacterium]|nr:ABC transporter permease [Actinomycetota bacterium]
MATKTAAAAIAPTAFVVRKGRPWHLTLRRNKRILIGGAILLFMLLVAVFAPVIPPRDPNAVQPDIRLAVPSGAHPFGTDNMGRDLFSRTVYGAQISLLVGGMVAFLAALAGTTGGLLGGYYKKVDLVLMRIMDGMMAFPSIILAVGIMAALGAQVTNVIVALAIVETPRIMRVVRSVVMGIRNAQYVEAARSVGARDARLLVRHILPNCISPLIVQSTFVFGTAVLGEASLSFLGVGVPPDRPSWGTILGEARLYISTAPWMMFLPGSALTITVLGLNLLGDGIRDWLDPRLRRNM